MYMIQQDYIFQNVYQPYKIKLRALLFTFIGLELREKDIFVFLLEGLIITNRNRVTFQKRKEGF